MTEKGLVAGFIATIFGAYFAWAIGGLGMWAALLNVTFTRFGGWLLLLFIGTTFGYLYSYFGFSRFFGKEAIVKGATYGVIIWIISLIISSIFPYLGDFTFADSVRTNLFLQLVSYIFWGSILGFLYEQK